MHELETVKSDLARLIANAMYLEIEELQQDQLFSDFGLESITLVKVLDAMSTKYDCALTINELLPHQTLNNAAAFIHGRVNEPSRT